ncbi:hypothetical protein GCM10007094_43820 [Pseudovibrio japonicus]|uniref:Uncharacterized protein n=1 Tax=Pseudovibrio japonicus TaxID=366534 RepID=A0ABQ3EPG6_9HYPH|nr:hypothetical protein GCM10007094_43820 [Pseudovibrio japonicus]
MAYLYSGKGSGDIGLDHMVDFCSNYMKEVYDRIAVNQVFSIKDADLNIFIAKNIGPVSKPHVVIKVAIVVFLVVRKGNWV